MADSILFEGGSVTDKASGHSTEPLHLQGRIGLYHPIWQGEGQADTEKGLAFDKAVVL